MKRTLKVVLVLLVLLTTVGFSQGAMTGACGESGSVFAGGEQTSPC